MRVVLSIFCACMLLGCSANQTEIEKVTQPAIKTIEETIDFAKNNIPETADTKLLISNLEGCHASLISCESMSNKIIEGKDKDIKNRELMIIIVAVIAFILGKVIKV